MRVNNRIGRGVAVAVGTTAMVAALGACSSNSFIEFGVTVADRDQVNIHVHVKPDELWC